MTSHELNLHHGHQAHSIHSQQSHGARPGSLNRLALPATLHCLTGCGIGEILGMALGTALGWGDGATITLAVALAFLFGYLLTMIPLLRAGLRLKRAVGLALAADTASITVMEIVDNAIMLLIPARWMRLLPRGCSGEASRVRCWLRALRPTRSIAGCWPADGGMRLCTSTID